MFPHISVFKLPTNYPELLVKATTIILYLFNVMTQNNSHALTIWYISLFDKIHM